MNLLPRSFATLALAVSAVPGVAPLAAHVHLPQHPAAHTAALPKVKQPTVPKPPATGGWTVQNPASAAVLNAATFAVESLSQTLGRHYVVEDVQHAQSQVVEGTNFQLKLRIAQLQGEILGGRKDCTVVVWSRPWLKPADKLTSFDCQSEDAAVPAAPVAPALVHRVVVADAKVAPKVAPKADKIDAKHACLVAKHEKRTARV